MDGEWKLTINININIYYIQTYPVTGWKTSSQTIGYRMCQNQNKCSESLEQVQIIQYKIHTTHSLNTTKYNHNRNLSARWKRHQPLQPKHTLRGTLMKTGPVRDAQQTKQCVYSIPCDCGRCYFGETSRPLQVRIKEHKYNLTQGLLEKSKLAQHAYEEGHRICWKF
jgi:hypothetical protein